jgi:hypothetical protein
MQAAKVYWQPMIINDAPLDLSNDIISKNLNLNYHRHSTIIESDVYHWMVTIGDLHHLIIIKSFSIIE